LLRRPRRWRRGEELRPRRGNLKRGAARC
jgi:hypothetical protein